MNCPNCQTANPDGAKFCNNCGTRLPAPCPKCGHPNPDGARFCNECGHHLAESQPASPPPAQTSTQVPIPVKAPGYLADKRSEERNVQTMEGARRIVSILFCDVKGSTAAAIQLDPEEWAEIMNGAFEQMIEPVYKYEGTVVRLLGDAILAFFGAPIAHEDDPQRAVLAGLEIIEAIGAYRMGVHHRWNIGFGCSLRYQHRSGRRGGHRFGSASRVLCIGRCREPGGADGTDCRARYASDRRGDVQVGCAIL